METGLKTETKVIDGLRVTCTQFPVLEQCAYLEKVTKLLAPMLLKDDQDAGLALFLSTMDMSSEELLTLSRAILRCTAVVFDGSNVELNSDQAINRVFAGRLPTMLKTVMFAAGVNYGNFFDAGSAESADGAGPAKASE